jgi:hypothetical protein
MEVYRSRLAYAKITVKHKSSVEVSSQILTKKEIKTTKIKIALRVFDCDRNEGFDPCNQLVFCKDSVKNTSFVLETFSSHRSVHLHINTHGSKSPC